MNTRATLLQRDVERLKSTLPRDLPRTEQPTLVVVSGLPGTGKSYFSRHLAQRLPLAQLESDVLRKALVGRPSYTVPENGRLFRAIHGLIRQLLASGTPVLLDATNLVEDHRKRLYRIADDLGVRLALVRLEAPEEVVHQRLERRQCRQDPCDQSDAGLEVYERMRARMDPIGHDHLLVDASEDIGRSVDRVVRWLSSNPPKADSERPAGM